MTYVVATVRTHSEESVAEGLSELGVGWYLPTFTMRVSNGRVRRQRVTRPAFPGYVFVEPKTVAYPEDLYDIPGFYEIVRKPENAEEYYIVPDEQMEVVRLMEERGMFTPKGRGKARFKKGELFRVIDGPAGGRVGEVREDSVGYVFLHGYDFPVAARITDLNLLRSHVLSGAVA